MTELGTDRLCHALYERDAQAKDYLGNANARMLHDAADRIKELEAINAQHTEEVKHLRKQRDDLQRCNTAEVMRRREYVRAAQYVLDHVPGYAGILDHLKHALAYRPFGMLESADGTTDPAPGAADTGDS